MKYSEIVTRRDRIIYLAERRKCSARVSPQARRKIVVAATRAYDALGAHICETSLGRAVYRGSYTALLQLLYGVTPDAFAARAYYADIGIHII